MKLILLLTLAITSLYPQEGSTPDTIWSRQIGVKNAHFSPDGSKIMVVGEDDLTIFDSFTGDKLDYIASGIQLNVLFLDNERLLYSNAGLIYDLTTKTSSTFGTAERYWGDSRKRIVNYSKNYIYKLENGFIETWNIETEKQISALETTSGDIKGLAISEESNKLCIAQFRFPPDQVPELMLHSYNLVDGIPVYEGKVAELFQNWLDFPHNCEFDETGTKLTLPTIFPMYFDYTIGEVVPMFPIKLEYFKGGELIQNQYFYTPNYSKLYSLNLLTNEITLKSNLLGEYTFSSTTHMAFAGGFYLYVFNKSDMLDPSSVEPTALPLVMDFNSITIEPQYNTSLYNHLGQDQSSYINNNIIDKSALPTGIYFLHIQNSTYNKVLKFYKEN
jgi:hypothetical protein